jgi:hypothetical protein
MTILFNYWWDNIENLIKNQAFTYVGRFSRLARLAWLPPQGNRLRKNIVKATLSKI